MKREAFSALPVPVPAILPRARAYTEDVWDTPRVSHPRVQADRHKLRHPGARITVHADACGTDTLAGVPVVALLPDLTACGHDRRARGVRRSGPASDMPDPAGSADGNP